MPTQSLIMPYHRGKAMLQYTISLLLDILPKDVEIIVIGNNDDPQELDVNLPLRIKYIKVDESMLYSKTVNMGVSMASGEIITLCDQDIFGYNDWYSPLLNKLLSDNSIGSVSSKLLNPATERIIDFGIEYTKYQITHSLRGHLSNHPLACVDRVVTSTTSAILMIKKELYEKVGGMDTEMPYCCSDCDIGIKIHNSGYKNLVVANSVAYHKGSSSSYNGKSLSFSHLRMNSHCMFWVKNFGKVSFSVYQDIERSYSWWASHHSPSGIYLFINLSGALEYKWYGECFCSLNKCKVADYCSYRSGQQHYMEPIQLYDVLPYSYMNVNTPLIYFVDYFPSLQANAIWRKMRDTSHDVVMDIHGNIVMLDEIISCKC